MPYLLILLALFLPASQATAATLSAQEILKQRQQFRAADAALMAGRIPLYHRLAKGLEQYPLYPYLEYHYLRPRLHSASKTRVQRFLDANPDLPVAGLLRRRWLRLLAKRGDWTGFLEVYTPQQDTSLQCLALRARIRTGQTHGITAAIRPLWLVGHSQPDECDPLFAYLEKSGTIDQALLWARIRLAMNKGNTRLARYLGRRLDVSQKQRLKLWLALHKHPGKSLQDRHLKADNAANRELLAHALRRLADNDVEQAIMAWQALHQTHQFSNAQRRSIQRRLAIAAVHQDSDKAVALLHAIPDDEVDETLQRYRLRAALEAQDWQALHDWTADYRQLPGNQLRWQYWQARALEELGQAGAAIDLYRELSAERDYYGFLASDRLGIGYSFNNHEISLSGKNRRRLLAIPGILRARELYRLDRHTSARREWYHATHDMDRHDLELAAALASDWGWHDRGILALGKARSYDDLRLRFPLPFRSLVSENARRQRIEPGLIYSLIRSESAFMEEARSHKGALGLMQLLPVTGKRTAKRIRVPLRRSHDLLRAETNIPIGSAYLRQMLDRFGGSLSMATAAYNAGPRRVRAWQPEIGCETAELWIEQIPFTETRRYVRNALFYSAIYDWRMGRPVRTIESHLTPIPPAQSASPVLACATGITLVYGQ